MISVLLIRGYVSGILFRTLHNITASEHGGVTESRIQRDFPYATTPTTWIPTCSGFSREINHTKTGNIHLCLDSVVLYTYKVFYMLYLMEPSEQLYWRPARQSHLYPFTSPATQLWSWEADLETTLWWSLHTTVVPFLQYKNRRWGEERQVSEGGHQLPCPVGSRHDCLCSPKEVTFSVQRSTSRLFYSDSVSRSSTPVTTDLLAKVYHDSGKQSNNLKRLVSLLSMYVSNSHAYMYCVCIYIHTHILINTHTYTLLVLFWLNHDPDWYTED